MRIRARVDLFVGVKPNNSLRNCRNGVVERGRGVVEAAVVQHGRHRFHERCLDANAVTATSANSSSSSTRAIASYRSHEYNWKRTAILVSIVVAATPVWLRVYKFGDKLFAGHKSPLHACRQGLFTWAFAAAMNPFFVTYITASQGYFIHGLRDPKELFGCVKERLERNYLLHVTAALGFWGVNWVPLFYLVPAHFRLLYAACLQIVWNGVVSYVQHRD